MTKERQNIYQRSNIGRAGECFYSNWNTMQWNSEDQVMESMAFQSKTSTYDSQPHSPHKDNWALDPIILIACMVAGDPNPSITSDSDPFLFPFLHKYKNIKNRCQPT